MADIWALVDYCRWEGMGLGWWRLICGEDRMGVVLRGEEEDKYADERR